MPDEVNQDASTENTTETGVTEAPTDYREYVKWRETGELPDPKAAAAETQEPPAKTAPDPAPDKTQEAEDEEETDTGEGNQPKRPGSRQRRIDKLIRENEELRSQLQGKPAEPARPAEPAKPAQPPGKPKLEDFQTLEDYQEALTDWKLDARDQKKRDDDAQQKAQDQRAASQADWVKRQDVARKQHDDYDEVTARLSKVPDSPGSFAAADAIVDDENGAELAYYLGKHPEEVKRIAGLSPVSAIREIGKLSATLSPSPATENGKPKISSAPKPPPSLTRPAKTSSDDINDPDVQRDWKRWNKAREAQLKGK
jgi:hypothetical protein